MATPSLVDELAQVAAKAQYDRALKLKEEKASFPKKVAEIWADLRPGAFVAAGQGAQSFATKFDGWQLNCEVYAPSEDEFIQALPNELAEMAKAKTLRVVRNRNAFHVTLNFGLATQAHLSKLRREASSKKGDTPAAKRAKTASKAEAKTASKTEAKAEAKTEVKTEVP